MDEEHAALIKHQGRSMFAWALCINVIAEVIELQISSDDTAHFTAQRRTHRDHRRADAERNIGRRNEGPIRLHRIDIPEPHTRIVAVFPEILLLELVALLVFEDSPHRQRAAWGGADQAD